MDRPITVVMIALSQNRVKALPAARAARGVSSAPRLRETREPPPTPTADATALSSRSTGATRLTAARAVSPTPCATNQALVSA